MPDFGELFLVYLIFFTICIGTAWAFHKAVFWVWRKIVDRLHPIERAKADLHESFKAKR